MTRIAGQDDLPSPGMNESRRPTTDTPAGLVPADAAELADIGSASGIARVNWLPLDVHGTRIDACILTGAPQRFDPGMFAEARMACPDRVARSVHKRQADFFFGRIAARLASARAGFAMPDLPIGQFGEPCWPPALAGSITHSRGLAAAVVASRSRIGALGIDIEHVVDTPGLDALWTIAVDAVERGILESLPAPLPIEQLASILFSAKESLFKAMFPTVQRMLGFDAAKLVALDPHACTLTFVLADGLDTAFPSGKHCIVKFRMLTPQAVFTYVAW